MHEGVPRRRVAHSEGVAELVGRNKQQAEAVAVAEAPLLVAVVVRRGGAPGPAAPVVDATSVGLRPEGEGDDAGHIPASAPMRHLGW